MIISNLCFLQGLWSRTTLSVYRQSCCPTILPHCSFSSASQSHSLLPSRQLTCIIATTVQWTFPCSVLSFHYTFILLLGCLLFNAASPMLFNSQVKKLTCYYQLLITFIIWLFLTSSEIFGIFHFF